MRNLSYLISCIRRLALSFFIIFFCFIVTACKDKSNNSSSNEQADVIRIGEVLSMTGTEATFGTSTHQGVELALKELNEKGGVKGKKLKSILLDNQGKASEAATAVTRLVSQDKVIAIIGEVVSTRSLAMAPIAQSFKIPMISPSSTNPKVTEQGDYIFRVCFIDPFQGSVMAKFAKENLKLNKVAILRDVKSDYSIGLSDFFINDFKKLGGEIVADQSYSNGDTDFRAQITSILSSKPEGLFLPGFYGDVALIARQAREAGLKIPIFGGDGWDSPKLIEIGGESLEGAYFSTHYSPEDTSPRVQEFITKFKAAYSVVPDALAATGYDAAYVLANAIERSPTLNPSDIRNAIASTKDFPAVTGNITIDEKRNSQKAAVVLKIEKGAYKYATTVNP
jgi:branched-chain amino acid transport system substrate-binding protein